MAASFALAKDSNANLDYTFDWTAYLGTNTIASATVTADTGLDAGTPTTAAKTVTVRLSGGTTGVTYSVVCHITSSTGEQDERTLALSIRDK